MIKATVVAAALLAVACSGPRTMYDWGKYEETLFIHFHDPALKEEALKKFIRLVESGGKTTRPVAPGLYAEAGTFMLEAGDLKSALKFYQMEYEAWPESRPMLGVLMENLETRIDE